MAIPFSSASSHHTSRCPRNPDSPQQVYCYDALDRITFAGYKATGPSPTCQSAFESTIAYDYDVGRRLVQTDDTTGGGTKIIARGYDDLDRMTSETTPEGGVSYTYDAASRRQSMTVTGQPTVTYTYFNNDLLKDIVRSTEAVSMAYDQANRPDTVTLPNAVVQDVTLNAAGDSTQIAYTGGQSLGGISYSYDGMGRRHGVWDSQARVALPAATTSNAVYDAANRLTSWNGAALSYDNAGNLTQDGSQTYTWNARGQLTATSAGSAAFAYDAFGRRSASTISGTTRGFVYDGWNAVQEKDGSGAVFANSLFGLGLDDVFWRKPVSSAGSSYLTDALGSTVALTDGSGVASTSYTYEPYGKPVSGDLINPFTFTGREWDSTVGLQLNRARYYSPAYGRFASEDPIGEAGGLNLYQYGASAPTTFTDPLGLDPEPPFLEQDEGCGLSWWRCLGDLIRPDPEPHPEGCGFVWFRCWDNGLRKIWDSPVDCLAGATKGEVLQLAAGAGVTVGVLTKHPGAGLAAGGVVVVGGCVVNVFSGGAIA